MKRCEVERIRSSEQDFNVGLWLLLFPLYIRLWIAYFTFLCFSFPFIKQVKYYKLHRTYADVMRWQWANAKEASDEFTLDIPVSPLLLCIIHFLSPTECISSSTKSHSIFVIAFLRHLFHFIWAINLGRSWYLAKKGISEARTPGVVEQELWNQNLRVWVPHLPLVSSRFTRKFHNLSEPQMVRVSNGNNFNL